VYVLGIPWYVFYSRKNLKMSPEEAFALASRVTAHKMLSTGLGYSYLYKQCEAEYSTENITCWQDIENFNKEPSVEGYKDIYETYLTPSSDTMANVPDAMFSSAEAAMEKITKAVERVKSEIVISPYARIKTRDSQRHDNASNSYAERDNSSRYSDGDRRDESIRSVAMFDEEEPLPMSGAVVVGNNSPSTKRPSSVSGEEGGEGGSQDPTPRRSPSIHSSVSGQSIHLTPTVSVDESPSQPSPMRDSLPAGSNNSGNSSSTPDAHHLKEGIDPFATVSFAVTLSSTAGLSGTRTESQDFGSTTKRQSPQRIRGGGGSLSPAHNVWLAKKYYDAAVKSALAEGAHVLSKVQEEVLFLMERDTLARFKASHLFVEYVEAEPVLFQGS